MIQHYEERKKQFAHLHVHTEYSLLDGATRLNKLFKKCYELEIPAVAITDHGNMFGALEFAKKAVKFSAPKANFYDFIANKDSKFFVKPIIGCEMYMTENMHERTTSESGRMPRYNHLVLLAKNETGYRNLVKLVSISYVEGLYYKPRIDFETLSQFSEGLIALSGCVAGVIPTCILDGQYDKADEWAKRYKALFNDDFYIEIQDHNIKKQKLVLPLLVDIARRNNIKLVATNDVHYLEKKDAFTQKILQCIAFRRTIEEDEVEAEKLLSEELELFGRNGVSFDGVHMISKPLEPKDYPAEDETIDDGYFPTKEFYLKSYDEMLALFPDLEEALTNTMEIVDKCSCDFFKKDKLFPGYALPEGKTPDSYLKELTYAGLEKKYAVVTEEIRTRADYELSVISKQGFSDYFLIVWDFIAHSERIGVPVGPGRGSGVGSIVAYSIGITKVDPLKYSLIFERFLNAERISNPDFDIDFCVEGREKIIEYVVEKYDAPNVSQIVTFGTLAAKAAVKDIGRVLNYPFADVDRITKLLPVVPGKNKLADFLGLSDSKKEEAAVIPELKNLYEADPDAKRIIDLALEIEGMPRQTGIHAAGVIICRDAIDLHIPLAKTGEGIVTTQFNKDECEELGLLKMDFLGLRTLTDIRKTLELVKKSKGIDIDLYDTEYNDPEVFNLIAAGDTHAVFQFESEGMKRFMRELKPTTFEDIIAGVALYRPGPMDKIGEYVHNKRNPDMVKYAHPLLEPILKNTYGIMIYQEQVMEMVQKLAGYSLGRADIVRRIMSKKKKEEMDAERNVFMYGKEDSSGVVRGCVPSGIPESIADKIYEDMTSFASYAFNKSHAAAYAVLTYQTAYLKRYHTAEFITAVLNNRIGNIDEISNYLQHLKDKGISVLPPSVNRSYAEFTVEDGAVRIGLAAIKNVGVALVENIIRKREEAGEFKDFVEFVERMDNITMNKKNLEHLIYAGAFDCFGRTRSQLMSVYDNVIERVMHDRASRAKGQYSFFDVINVQDDFSYPNFKEYPLSEKLKKEREVAGVYLTGHPLDEYSASLKNFEHNTAIIKSMVEEAANIGGFVEDKQVTLAGMLVGTEKRFTKLGKEIGLAKIEDMYGTLEIMLSSFKYAVYKEMLRDERVVVIHGRVSPKDDSIVIWVDKMEELRPPRKQTTKKLCIYLSFRYYSKRVMKAERVSSEDVVVSLREAMSDILEAYDGEDEGYIKNTDDGAIYSFGRRIRVCTPLENELYGIESVEEVKVV